jgi:hypothetical protein
VTTAIGISSGFWEGCALTHKIGRSPSQLNVASKSKSGVREVVARGKLNLRRFEGGSLMNRILIAVFTTALLCGSLLGQPPQSPSTAQAPSANSAPRIAPGSVIPARLTKTINAKKAKKGDEVVATVTQDLQNNAGTVLVPKDTKIVGHITDAQARTKQQKESEVTIAFDRAIPKNGEPMQMPMSIQAIIAPPNRNPANTSAEQPSGYPGPETGGVPTGPSGRQGSMGGGVPPTANAPQTSGGAPREAPAGTQAQQAIRGDTKGVVGIENLKLSAAADATLGSVVSSEKSNVKLDDGTFLLLRVNQ